jgi:DNA-directed RNA polymerase subunit RPC12/RpoP
MNKLLMAVLVFVAVGLLFLGALFLIGATAASDYAVGGVMLLIAVVMLIMVWRLSAGSPTIVQQNIQLGGSGQFQEKRMACRQCGAPIEQKDIKVVQGGLMVTCPYCSAVYALEEAPKW